MVIGRRKHFAHTIIFFIFIVSNTGGCLTPLGDPPLFLGFLKGIPLEWTFTLWKPWLLVNLFLLFIYYLWDNVAYKNEKNKDVEIENKIIESISVSGGINFLFLGGVVLAVAFSAFIAVWFKQPAWESNSMVMFCFPMVHLSGNLLFLPCLY